MRRIIFAMVGSMLIGVCAVQAQQDEAASRSRNKQQKDQNEKTSDTHWNRDQAWQQQSDRSQYANEGMVEIQKSQIPSSLKKTLKDEKYAGWENATIYHNTNTGEYVIAPRAYRFDEKGKEIEMGDDNAYGSNRSGGYSSDDRNASDRMDQQPSQSRQPGHMSQDQRTQGQSDNGQATGQSQSYDQSGNTQQPSSGYRSGEDAANDRTDGTQGDGTNTGNQSQMNGTSTTPGTNSGNQSQSNGATGTQSQNSGTSSGDASNSGTQSQSQDQ